MLLTIALSTVTPYRELPRTVWLLVMARAVNRLGAFTLPFLSLTLVTELRASLGQAGWLLAAFGLATIPSRLLGGWLADRWGTRSTIVIGLLATAFAQVLVAASQTLTQVGVAVGLLGLAYEIYEPPSQSLIAEATSPEQRPGAFGLLAAALAAAGMGAGVLAALLAHLDLRWLFVADAATCLLCAAVVRWRLPRRCPLPPATGLDADPWRDRRLLLLLALGSGFAVVYLQIAITLPLTVTARGLSASSVGTLMTVAAATVVLAQPLLSIPWLRRLDDWAVLAAGHVVLAAGLLLTGWATSAWTFAVATVVWSIGDLVLLGRAYALVSAIAPVGGRGAYLAAFGTSWGIAGVVAPLVGTQLLRTIGPAATWSVLAGVCLAVSAAYLRARALLGPGLPQPRAAEGRAATALRDCEPSPNASGTSSEPRTDISVRMTSDGGGGGI
jgi:MFS family permease